jgi:hypothetical protein
MGSFYRNAYDLYAEISGDPALWLGKAVAALGVVGRSDLETDVKDAVQEISLCGNFEEAARPAATLLAMLEQAVGVAAAIRKR